MVKSFKLKDLQTRKVLTLGRTIPHQLQLWRTMFMKFKISGWKQKQISDIEKECCWPSCSNLAFTTGKKIELINSMYEFYIVQFT